ncbi:MAG: hypothetical protein NC041_05985 [Bacteroides sp.]|nr:hypothetical protein [Prevotella sp.]MCM1407506.1 hypothetical protein [Treponema brennaborense]MCM1469996.1 hypothetical protein [Bacteroides sp.]
MNEKYDVKTLTLYTPLRFKKNSGSGSEIPNSQEMLAVYTHAVSKYDSAPDKEKYLTRGQFCGFGLFSNTDGSAETAPAAADENALSRRQTDGTESEYTVIPAGMYLFTQGACGNFSEDEFPQPNEQMQNAAEAVYLESLWLEKTFAGSDVYVRVIKKSGGAVFQIFRQLAKTQEPQ